MNDNEYYPYAYSAIGKRYYEARPGHHTKRLSMIGAWCNQQFQAPLVFDGYSNTDLFTIYIEKILIPTLKPGMTVIIDNASFHKSASIKHMIQKAQCD